MAPLRKRKSRLPPMLPPKVRARARSAERQIPHPPPRFRIPSAPPGCRVARPPEPPLPNTHPQPRPMRHLGPRQKDERPSPRRLRPAFAPLLPWQLPAPRPLPYRPQAPAALRRDGNGPQRPPSPPTSGPPTEPKRPRLSHFPQARTPHFPKLPRQAPGRRPR